MTPCNLGGVVSQIIPRNRKEGEGKENEISGGNGHPQGKGDNGQSGGDKVFVCRVQSPLRGFVIFTCNFGLGTCYR